MRLRIAAIGLFALGATSRSGAQAVRGVVTAEQGEVVAGAVVVLIDSATSEIASNRVLTSERGEYVLIATHVGAFRIRAQRIGFRPTLSEYFHTSAAATRTINMVLAGVRIALDTVRVASKSSCRAASHDSVSVVFAVWDQARLALAATQTTTAARTIWAKTLNYQRTLDHTGRRVLDQNLAVRLETVQAPWRTLSPDSLHRIGYVFSDDDSVAYFAPGIEALLATQFVEDHCFRLTSSTDGARIGLSFEPVSDRKRVSEIAGTLWLDRRSAELRTLEFRYVNISRAQSQVAGGEMSFLRLQNGAQIVSRWSIRMPALEQRPAVAGKYDAEIHVREIHVTGGELALAINANSKTLDTLWARPPLRFRGVIFDSVTNAPVAGATVALEGTTLQTTSDVRGEFAFDDVLSGEYTLLVRSAWHDALGAANQSVVSIAEGAAPTTVRIASARQVADALCGYKRFGGTGQNLGVVVGNVEAREDSLTLSGVRIFARWQELGVAQAGRTIAVVRPQHILETKSDSAGAFRLCGVPFNSDVSVYATSPAASSLPVLVTIHTEDRFAHVSLVLDKHVVARATLTGAVVESATLAAVGDAEVAVDAAPTSARSKPDGTFSIADIPTGAHAVRVRRIGFLPLDTTLDFDSREVVTRTIVLRRASVLDSVKVEADYSMRSFEENRRVGLGRFLVRADLNKKFAQSTPSIMRELPGIQIMQGRGGKTWLASSRGPKSVSGTRLRAGDETDRFSGAKSACYANVYVDRVKMYGGLPGEPLFDLSSIRPDDIEAIEYYAGPAQTPSQYNNLNATCGVLVIWRRK